MNLDRSQLINQVNRSIEELNQHLMAHPEGLTPNQTRVLRDHLAQLITNTRNLEAQRAGLHENWWSRNGYSISFIFFSVALFGEISLITANLFQFIPSLLDTPQNQTTAPQRSTMVQFDPSQPLEIKQVLTILKALLINQIFHRTIIRDSVIPAALSSDPFSSPTLRAVTALIILGIVCSVVGGFGTFFADRKDKKERETRHKLDNYLQVKEVGEMYLDRILERLDEYHNRPRDQRRAEDVREFIQDLNKIPKDGLKKLKKQTLIPRLIEGLPDDNPLFIDYNRLRRTATEELTDPDTTSSTSELEDMGERATAAASMPSFAAFRANKQKSYQQLWLNIEQTIGRPIKKLHIGDRKILHKGGHITEIPAANEDAIAKQFEYVAIEL